MSTIIKFTNAQQVQEEVIIPKDKYIIQLSDLSIKFTDPANSNAVFSINFNSRQEYNEAASLLKGQSAKPQKEQITG